MAKGYQLARQGRKQASGSIGAIEPMPKTSFTDKDLDPKYEPSGDNKVSSDNAKSGSSVSPLSNAPKQQSKGTGFTKPDSEGLTKT